MLVVLKWMMLCEQGRMWRGEEARQRMLALRLQAVRGLLGRALQMWRRLLVWLLGKRWWHEEGRRLRLGGWLRMLRGLLGRHLRRLLWWLGWRLGQHLWRREGVWLMRGEWRLMRLGLLEARVQHKRLRLVLLWRRLVGHLRRRVRRQLVRRGHRVRAGLMLGRRLHWRLVLRWGMLVGRLLRQGGWLLVLHWMLVHRGRRLRRQQGRLQGLLWWLREGVQLMLRRQQELWCERQEGRLRRRRRLHRRPC